MPWSEEQKYAGRLELRRRRDTETPSSRQAAFLKMAFVAILAVVLTYILVWVSLHGADRRLRLEGALFTVITAGTMLFALLLAYVRFLEWRQGR